MSDLEIGRFKIDTKFLVTFFVLVIISYLVISGKLDPLEIWHNVVNWISAAIKKIGIK